MVKKQIILIFSLFFGACAVFIPFKVGAPEDIKVEITPERVALGKKLTEGILACGSCHTSGSFMGDPQQDLYLAGDVMTLKMEGSITAPNITPHKETGIGSWTDGEIIRALTKGLNRDNRQLVPIMPWPEFGLTLTEEEIFSVVAYLRTVPEAVNNPVPKNDLNMPVKIFMSTGLLYKMFTKGPLYGEYKLRTDTAVERGKRLAYLGKCVDCHAYAPNPNRPPKFGQPLAGGLVMHKIDAEAVVCSNLTADVETGIGGFSDEELFMAIKYGKRLRPLPETEMLRWPMMARIPYHITLTDTEINELIAYLRTQKAIKLDIYALAEKLNNKAK